MLGPTASFVRGNDFERAFACMPNLVEVQFDCGIDEAAFLRACRAELCTLSCYPMFCGSEAFYDFLSRQTTLTRICLGDVNRGPERRDYRPNILPNLTQVAGFARDLVYLVPSRPVEYVKLLYSATDKKRSRGIPLPFLSQESIIRLELAGYHLAKPIEARRLLPNLKQLVIVQDIR